MIFDIYFSKKEQIDFLRSNGFAVKQTVVHMLYPCYHNDVDEEDVKVMAVYKDGKEYHKPVGYSFSSDKWVESVFEEEMSNKIKKLLLK